MPLSPTTRRSCFRLSERMTDAGTGTPAADVLRAARGELAAAGSPTPDLDARLLLAEALGVEPAAIHSASSHRLYVNEAARFEGLLARRCRGEPVHRILGRRAFHDHVFQLSEETLEPRPETETLVELADDILRQVRGPAPLLADIGTGSGAIVVSLLALHPSAHGVALDLSEGALRTARANAETAGVATRMLVVCGDYLSGLGGGFDLIVSNPPYIRKADIETLDRGVREYDPHLALDGGVDGLAAYRALAADAARCLKAEGRIAVEIGAGQAEDVTAIFGAAGLRAEERRRDLAGHLRALSFARCR